MLFCSCSIFGLPLALAPASAAVYNSISLAWIISAAGIPPLPPKKQTRRSLLLVFFLPCSKQCVTRSSHFCRGPCFGFLSSFLSIATSFFVRAHSRACCVCGHRAFFFLVPFFFNRSNNFRPFFFCYTRRDPISLASPKSSNSSHRQEPCCGLLRLLRFWALDRPWLRRAPSPTSALRSRPAARVCYALKMNL